MITSPNILLSPFMDAIFPRVAIFFDSTLKSSMIFKVPDAGGDLFKSDAPWPCLLMFSVLLDVFSQIYVGLSFPQSPYLLCISLSWRSGGYESPRFCWFPKNVLRKGIGKMKMPPKCQGAIGDLIKGHQDRQVVDGWPVAKNHFH